MPVSEPGSNGDTSCILRTRGTKRLPLILQLLGIVGLLEIAEMVGTPYFLQKPDPPEALLEMVARGIGKNSIRSTTEAGGSNKFPPPSREWVVRRPVHKSMKVIVAAVLIGDAVSIYQIHAEPGGGSISARSACGPTSNCWRARLSRAPDQREASDRSPYPRETIGDIDRFFEAQLEDAPMD